MIISHKYKFIFIKTFKTAGTSIEVFLSQCCDEDDVITPIWPHVEPHLARNYRGLFNPIPEIVKYKGRNIGRTLYNLVRKQKYYNHIPALTVEQRTPKMIWSSYYKFCVERNPWDKTLSHYHMINDRSGGCLALDDYIKEENFCINYPKYTDNNGLLLVDKVVKYESLIDDLEVVFRDLGVTFDGSLGVKAKSGHRKDRRPYQEIFSNKQRDVIGRAFEREIELHGYTF